MDITLIGYVSAAFLVFALVSRRASRSVITGPMFFTAAGLFAAAVQFGDPPSGNLTPIVEQLLEFTLAIVLFTDAMTTDLKSWQRDGDLPGRLLVVAMPLVMLAGAITATALFPELDLLTGLILATILAPTDAALGKPVVSNERVPVRVREALNIESGLNDGVALPFLLFFISLAEAREDEGDGENFFELLGTSLGLAAVVGLAGGWIGAHLVRLSSDRGWIQPKWRQIAVVALAALLFVIADEMGGSGFIAAFVGGLVFGRLVHSTEPEVDEFAEDLSAVLTMLSFLVFGGYILKPVLSDVTWQMVVYATLSLTVVRIVPVALSMIGTHLRWPTIFYIGWFGPRGLASLVFSAVVLEEAGLAETDPLVTTASITVAMSILLHGITAYAGANAYARWYQREHPKDERVATTEGREVAETSRKRSSLP